MAAAPAAHACSTEEKNAVFEKCKNPPPIPALSVCIHGMSVEECTLMQLIGSFPVALTKAEIQCLYDVQILAHDDSEKELAGTCWCKGAAHPDECLLSPLPDEPPPPRKEPSEYLAEWRKYIEDNAARILLEEELTGIRKPLPPELDELVHPPVTLPFPQAPSKTLPAPQAP